MIPLDHLSKQQILQYQEVEMIKLLNYLNTYSPYYIKLFNKHNYDINSFKHLTDITQIPTTSKYNLQASNWDFLCVDKSKIIEYCTTSGTLGAPVIIALTENDLKRLAYNECQSFKQIGATEFDLFQLMVSLDRQFMAGLAYYSGVRQLGAGIVRVGPGNIALQFEMIKQLNPTILISVPTFIINLIHFAKENNINLNDLNVRKILCVGENIRDLDFQNNSIASKIIENWNVSLFSTYASTEKQTAFTECAFQNGGHHLPELIYFEILDENENQLSEKEFGELTITTFGVEGMPLLRYKTGDICSYYTDPCPCGKSTFRLGPIIGRKHQMIKYNGTTLFPQTMFNILNGLDEIQDYFIELRKSTFNTDDILIHIATFSLNDTIEKKIKSALQSNLKVLPKIEFKSISIINKMQIISGQRKLTKFIDLR